MAPVSNGEASAAGRVSDETLMTRVAAGEEELYGELYERHFGGVARFAMRVFSMNAHDAEEAAQTVFMKVYGAAGRYDVKAKFTSYLYRVARNECLKMVAKKRPIYAGAGGSDETGASRTENAARRMEAEELGERIAQVFGTLSIEQRTAVQLRDGEGMSYEQIAATMDATVAAVNTWIHRGRKSFAARFRENYGDVYAV